MMRIGIFFGGGSREREISFAGGRTVYDNLDKNLFEAIPIFVDSLGNFIELDWRYIYKGTIRDFYPPVQFLPNSPHNFQIYIEAISVLTQQQTDKIINSVGKKISIEELKNKIDFAFLALHGAWGEDGTLQGILEWLHIPYTGSGILPSSIGMDKVFQKKVMKQSGYDVAKSISISRANWFENKSHQVIFKNAIKKVGLPFVVRPANQGSSIGVSIVHNKNINAFTERVEAAFFVTTLAYKEWKSLNEDEKIQWVRKTAEIKDGTGIPFIINNEQINHPEELLKFITKHFSKSKETLTLQSIYEEQEVLIEEFIDGIEFSCIVVRDENGNSISLPPTEIKKGKEVFDYRSKYLAGITRKVTPINLPDKEIERIRKACEELFEFFNFHVYARIDGFVRKRDQKIFLNDPNTTSGMLPSSFFFHQAAEIGLNPSQFLTFIIRTSISERSRSQTITTGYRKLLIELDENISGLKKGATTKKKIAVVLGGYSTERHISVESGRNIFEKLASSTKYEPIPVFLIGNEETYSLYQIPINLLLKDNADDIKDKILHFKKHPAVEKIKKQTNQLTHKYISTTSVFEPKKISVEELSKMVEGVFIALHGRPGEDGQLQNDLEKYNLPFNGSGVLSSQITINKYQTNEILKQNGIMVANHLLVQKNDWIINKEKFYTDILTVASFPFICKPVDDGCSSAVKIIRSKEELDAFCHLMFRERDELKKKYCEVLSLKINEEFPRKQSILVEELITANGAAHFLEITGGMLTKINSGGEISFEVFEPSEALSTGEVLSLEEKFLAGEGQNITPARFAKNSAEYERVASIVKKELEKTARVLNVTGYCRIDAFVRIFDSGKVETIIIEVNSLPGMTPATCIFHQAALNKYKPFDFIDQILEFSFQKNKLIEQR